MEKFVKQSLKAIKVESLLNREDDSLPYAYFSPESEGKVTWVCGPDAEGHITSVFCGLDGDRQCKYINTEEAQYIRDELVKDRWQKLKPPTVTFSHPNNSKPSARKEKRFLQKEFKKLNRSNPLRQSTRGVKKENSSDSEDEN
uniref:Uncharacterized protein n=1 Tax=Marseillevirus LCMAC102 TaxID=2506603 RepID=A0A481YTE6_9VIRU|nr:MAG: hypothetical protein LCMAC102_03680 [Marseillevirus LCMAC102]